MAWAGRKASVGTLQFNLPRSGLHRLSLALQYWSGLTTAFLAGIGPVGLAFGGLCWFRLHRIWAVAALFERWTPQVPRREVHRFRDEEEVEIVARCASGLHRLCRQLSRRAHLV